MSIRIPITIKDYNNTTETVAPGNNSVLGGFAVPFVLPQDTDNVVVKYQTSTVGGGASALFQTSDDGGTTWYDVARTSVVSNATAANPAWLSVSTISPGISAGIVLAGGTSVVSQVIRTTSASTLGANAVSGLPILGLQNRVFIQYGAALTSVKSERVTVLVNNQANRA